MLQLSTAECVPENMIRSESPVQVCKFVSRGVTEHTKVDDKLSSNETEFMKAELQKLIYENTCLKREVDSCKYNLQSFVEDDNRVKYYTGLPCYSTLKILFDLTEPFITNSVRTHLTKFQKLLMTLMKLRLNLCTQDLAYRFNVSASTVSRIFNSVIHIMYVRIKDLILWPEREQLRLTMPMEFRKNFGLRVAVIIDCFEIKIERPSSLLSRAQTWSNYKHHNTIKFLIGICPQGAVTFLSKAWGGRASDKHIAENCGLMEKLLPGDLVLADRGFDISESVGLMCAEVKIPSFTKGKQQLSPMEVQSTKKIANVRIHVERVIGLVRNKFTILRGVLPIDYLQSETNEIPLIDKIATVCCGICNLCESVVPSN